MKQLNFPKKKNLHHDNSLFQDKKNTATITTHNLNDEEKEEDDIKKMRKLILTKNLFAINPGINNEMKFEIFSKKRKSHCEFGPNKDLQNIYMNENSNFYDEFLNKLKEENKIDGRKRNKKNDNNYELLTINKNNIEHIQDIHINRNNNLNEKGYMPKIPMAKYRKKKKSVDEMKNLYKSNEIIEPIDNRMLSTENKENKLDHKYINCIKRIESTNEDKINQKIDKNIEILNPDSSHKNVGIFTNSNEFNQSSPKIFIEAKKKSINKNFKLENNNIILPPIPADIIKKTLLPTPSSKISNSSLFNKESDKKEIAVDKSIKENTPIKQEENRKIGSCNISFVNSKNSEIIKERKVKNKGFCGCFPLFY